MEKIVKTLGDVWEVCRTLEIPFTFEPCERPSAYPDVDTLRVRFVNTPEGRRAAALEALLVLHKCRKLVVCELSPEGALVQIKPPKRVLHSQVTRLAVKLGLQRFVVPRKEHDIPVLEGDDYPPHPRPNT